MTTPSVLALLAESAQDCIFLLGHDEKIIYINPFGAEFFGANPSQLIGKKIPDLFDKDLPLIRSLLTQVLQTKKPLQAEEKISFPQKSLWLETRFVPVLDEKANVTQIMGISRDVTERKNNETNLRLQAEALHAASNAIVITDLKGVIQWVNTAFETMTGYTYDEVKGKTPRVLKSGEQKPEAYKELWATVLAGKTWSGELINRRKDGSLYFEKQTITPVRTDGALSHFIAIKDDISNDKRLEAQFRQAQKMEAVGRLAGGIAHDFNNLLTVIIGHSDFALMRLSADDRVRENIDEIRRAGNRAAGLTRQLLAFSRKQIFQIKVTDLNQIVLGTDKMLRRLLGEDVELVTLLTEKLPPVKVDTFQIEQVIMNLAVNARDAMPKGGKLVIQTTEAKIDERTASLLPGMQAGLYVVLTLRDSGTGLSEEAKTHLFEPFFTTKEKGKGTGLGLATVYGIVKQSKGFIYADSQAGQGTAFNIYLPLADEQPAQSFSFQDLLPLLPQGTETVLVVEDEELVRGLAVRILQKQGFRVFEARNGLEALEVAEKNPQINLLLSDMVMPYMGGRELAENFVKICPKAKIIFTSGYTDSSSVQPWLEKGCRFLQKPYSHAELLLLIRDFLDTR